MITDNLLGITIKLENKNTILDKIKKYVRQPSEFFHIVSLNPENMVIANENRQFKKVIRTAQIKLVDGMGVVLAGRVLGVKVGERLTGVEVMKEVVKLAQELSSRVLLIGGRPNLALKLAKCYQESYPKAKFIGLEGFKNINTLTTIEEEVIFSIVGGFKPNIILAAFGSPEQELWFYKNKNRLTGIVCLGVGQGFDIAGGIIKRAPVWVRKIGLEWLYRLLIQPWRWRRQIRLVKFGWLVIRQKIGFVRNSFSFDKQ